MVSQSITAGHKRPEILHTGTYWSPVAGDQKLGHPDLLCGVFRASYKMLISALSLQATDLQSPDLHPWCIWQGCNSCLAFDVLLGVKGGHNGQKTFWANQGGTNRNWCTQRVVILYVQTH